MNTTTLQIPVSKSLKTNAQEVAKKLGFSSLQEVVRIFLTQLVSKKVTIGITAGETPDEILTPEQEKVLLRKYKEAKKDIAEGNYFVAHNVEEMMEQLRS